MEITEYHVQLCQGCYRVRGHVQERFNGRVTVQCVCMKGRVESPVMIGGVGARGVYFLWRPISGYIDENGNSWHRSHHGASHGYRGEPSDQAAFDEWAKEHMPEGEGVVPPKPTDSICEISEPEPERENQFYYLPGSHGAYQ